MNKIWFFDLLSKKKQEKDKKQQNLMVQQKSQENKKSKLECINTKKNSSKERRKFKMALFTNTRTCFLERLLIVFLFAWLYRPELKVSEWFDGIKVNSENTKTFFFIEILSF